MAEQDERRAVLTAAQAAQNVIVDVLRDVLRLTAAQAAQNSKLPRALHAGLLTAAQAAQNSLRTVAARCK